jgi:hypothetical protein
VAGSAWLLHPLLRRQKSTLFAGTLGDRKKFTEGGLLITLSSLLCSFCISNGGKKEKEAEIVDQRRKKKNVL